MRHFKAVLLALVVVVTLLSYLPGLSGAFVLDDQANLTQNPRLIMPAFSLGNLWEAAWSGDAGPFKRPISMMSFSLNLHYSGPDVFAFRATNLAIHILNGLLIFLLSQRLIRLLQNRQKQNYHQPHFADYAAIAIAALWLLHPYNLSAVLYVVQRMTSLSAMFTFIGLYIYLVGRSRLIAGDKAGLLLIGVSVFVMTPLAALCKESGILLPLFILITEVTLLRWQTPDKPSRHSLLLMVGGPVAVLAVAGAIGMALRPGFILDGYSIREFTLTERLMTEARVIWSYLLMILAPNPGAMGLHHDDIQISSSLLLPWSTLPAIAGLVALATFGALVRNRLPIISFGIGFFLAGHLLESTVFPLEIAFEHRNYLPMLGIMFPLGYYLLNSGVRTVSLKLRVIISIGAILLFGTLTASRAQEWGNPYLMQLLEVQRHPNSIRANSDIAAFYNYLPPTSQEEAVELYNKARFHYQRSAELAPLSLSGPLGLLVVASERGLEADPALVQEIEHRLAHAPFNPPNKNSLIGLVRCIRNTSCKVDPTLIDRLYRATLSNPTLRAHTKASIRTEFEQLPAHIWPTQIRTE